MLTVIFIHLSVHESREQIRDFTGNIVAPVVVEQSRLSLPMAGERANTPHVALCEI